MTNAEAAAWVQSVGSVVAILVSVWIARAADRRAAAAEKAAADRELAAIADANNRAAKQALESAEDRAYRERRAIEDANNTIHGAILEAQVARRRAEHQMHIYFDAANIANPRVLIPEPFSIATEGCLNTYIERSRSGPVLATLYALREQLSDIYFGSEHTHPRARYEMLSRRVEQLEETDKRLRSLMTPLEHA